MEAEVPLGYLLSGGLDSSAVCAMAAEKSKRPLQTFSMSFEEESFDESNHAAAVAAHLGTDHRSFRFASGDLSRVLKHIEEDMSEERQEYYKRAVRTEQMHDYHYPDPNGPPNRCT